MCTVPCVHTYINQVKKYINLKPTSLRPRSLPKLILCFCVFVCLFFRIWHSGQCWAPFYPKDTYWSLLIAFVPIYLGGGKRGCFFVVVFNFRLCYTFPNHGNMPLQSDLLNLMWLIAFFQSILFTLPNAILKLWAW